MSCSERLAFPPRVVVQQWGASVPFHSTVRRKGLKTDVPKLVTICTELGASAVVVGLPLDGVIPALAQAGVSRETS